MWKVVSFATLVALTATLSFLGVSLYSRPYDLYMKAQKSNRPFPGVNYINLENMSDVDRDAILSYLEASNTIGNYIKVSDEWCSIRHWADSVYQIHGSLINVKHEDYYYSVSFWPRESYSPSAVENNAHTILTTLTIILWVIFVLLVSRDRGRQQTIQAGLSKAHSDSYDFLQVR